MYSSLGITIMFFDINFSFDACIDILMKISNYENLHFVLQILIYHSIR